MRVTLLSLIRSFLAAAVLLAVAADASAGPLARLRARRSGGCGPCGAVTGCTPNYAPAAHLSGCAGGKCPIVAK